MATRAEKIHEMLASHFGKAHDAHMVALEGESLGSSAHTFHKTMGQHCLDAKNDHVGEMEDCAKASRDEMAKRGNELVPSGVSIVAPDRPNIRAVPRYGQSEVKMTVAPELVKILGLDEADQNSEK